jgi:hypothetical protein
VSRQLFDWFLLDLVDVDLHSVIFSITGPIIIMIGISNATDITATSTYIIDIADNAIQSSLSTTIPSLEPRLISSTTTVRSLLSNLESSLISTSSNVPILEPSLISTSTVHSFISSKYCTKFCL